MSALHARLRWSPRSLFGQIALVVALALFVAQAINFALLFEGRRQIGLQAIVGPAVARAADAEDRIAAGRFNPGPRARIRLESQNPIASGAERRPDIERAIMAGLGEAGVATRQVAAAIRPLAPDDFAFGPRFRRARPLPPDPRELVIGIKRSAGDWLVIKAPWPRGGGPLVAPLIIQTVILYLALLVPLLWVTQRISNPLRSLALAASAFRPGETAAPLDETGPNDVRVVIAAFNALRLRVAAMLDEKDRMLGAIGHDLRTPLAALRVRIESVDDDHDREKMAETIDEMSSTLDDILSLARLGRPSEPVTEVDLGALAEAVVDDFTALGASVSFTPAPRLTLRLRPVLMRRAVRNLIENAVKYAGSADVSIISSETGARILIKDSGPGIPPERIDEVFDSFTRIEGSRSRDTGGAGLGLTLARAIAREGGGEVTLTNRAQGGLEAAIWLPRR